MKNYDEQFVRKIRAIYGTRASLKLNNEVLTFRKKSMKTNMLSQQKKDEEKDIPKEKILWYQLLIISPDSQWKSSFDLMVLLFVGYSCIFNVLYFAFPIDESTNGFKKIDLFNKISEVIFYVDFIFSFF
jgi:hypothetical protein